jgi:RyR domain
MSQLFSPDQLQTIARVVHEANRAYCVTLGDHSQKSWDETPDDVKQSAIDGINHITESHTTITPRDSHENWCAFKRSQGWTYGPVKDSEKKTHPSLKPYEELWPAERVKDAIFIGIVQAFIDDMKVSYE